MKSIVPTNPVLTAHRLASLPLDSWETIAAALGNAPTCQLQQAWLAKPSKDFRPARVRTAWTEDALVVYAELEDRDIFNPETRFNELAFTRGDAFEIFLRPLEQETYFEFHITPHNQKLQLRIPSYASLRTCGLEQLKIHEPLIWTRTHIQHVDERWLVLALVPFDLVMETGKIAAGSRWLFSFSRYDYTRDCAEPTLSSTSLHLKGNFHHQHEWGLLRFEE